jgi:hypothetical protein
MARLSVLPLMTPTTPVRPMPVTTSSQPNSRSLSATSAEVRWVSYISSGFSWMSRRHAVISACNSARRFLIGMVVSPVRLSVQDQMPGPDLRVGRRRGDVAERKDR